MNGIDLLEAMSFADLSYVDAAEHTAKYRKNIGKRRMSVLAACLSVLLIMGVTVGATDLYGQLAKYFSGNSEKYMENIIASSEIASNEEWEFRVDGAISDSHTCHIVISLTGKTKQAQQKLKENVTHISKKSFFSEIDMTAVAQDGTLIPFWNQSAQSFGHRTGWRSYQYSFLEDTDLTYLVSCEFDNWSSMKNVKEIRLMFHDLSISLDVNQYMTDEVALYAEEETAPLQKLTMSELGLYFEAPVSMFYDESKQNPHVSDTMYICLIDRYGEVIEHEKYDNPLSYGTGYNPKADWAFVSGSWKFEKPMEIGIIDLEDYCGIQIDGFHYYYREPARKGE